VFSCTFALDSDDLVAYRRTVFIFNDSKFKKKGTSEMYLSARPTFIAVDAFAETSDVLPRDNCSVRHARVIFLVKTKKKKKLHFSSVHKTKTTTTRVPTRVRCLCNIRDYIFWYLLPIHIVFTAHSTRSSTRSRFNLE